VKRSISYGIDNFFTLPVDQSDVGHLDVVTIYDSTVGYPSEAMEAITPAPRGSMTLALVVHWQVAEC